MFTSPGYHLGVVDIFGYDSCFKTSARIQLSVEKLPLLLFQVSDGGKQKRRRTRGRESLFMATITLCCTVYISLGGIRDHSWPRISCFSSHKQTRLPVFQPKKRTGCHEMCFCSSVSDTLATGLSCDATRVDPFLTRGDSFEWDLSHPCWICPTGLLSRSLSA